MLDVSYNRHSDTLPAKELLWIFLLIWTISSSLAININCCPDSTWSSSSKNCSDGTKIRLTCLSDGYYIIDSKEENFTIIEEHGMPWLQFVEMSHIKLKADSFCVTNWENNSQVVLTCFEGEHYVMWKNTLFCILSIISAIFLIATLAVYVLLPELREVQDKAMMAVVTSLAVSYIILSVQNLRLPEEEDYMICASLGFILYFAKAIINATGPFTDHIRKMDDQNVKEICSPSSGAHIVLPGYYSPDQMGLLDPETSDGRVIFFLPWQKQTIAGTTDLPCEITHNPRPTEDEIMFILHEVKNYLNPDVEVRRGDVLSAWSGIRPLVSDPNKPDTQSLARNHIVHVSPTKLITIAGGKWTTYRAMAEETIDAAIKACDLKPERPCQTNGLLLEGAHGWSPTMYIRLVQDFGLECEVAQHLAKSYGDRAFAVAKMASLTGKRWPIIGKKLHPEFPYIDAEIRYGVREYARTAIDMIARRLRLAFLNVQAAQEALPGIIDIMAEELHWSPEEKNRQTKEASEFLANEMGQMVNRASRDKIPINLTKEEIQLYIKRFGIIDKDNKGYVSINDIRRGLKVLGIKLNEDEIHTLLNEIDLNYNGQMELQDYLQMMSAIKSGHVAYSRFARMAEMEEAQHEKEILKKQISVERSGGGL